MNMGNLARLVVSILVCQAAGAVGSIFTVRAIPTWYAALNKPTFTPPSWLFGPVWIGLYTLMGISLYLVLRKGWDNRSVRVAVCVFALQLLLNALWTPLFFGLHWLLPAFFEIVLLWALILVTIRLFYGLSASAGLLLVPYAVWVGFASVLNLSFWLLNR